MTSDPTREEMLAVLAAWPFIDETDDFDREAAIYWFASDWHSGQTSNLYSVLSTSPYSPGPLESEPEPGTMAAALYQELEVAFCKEG